MTAALILGHSGSGKTTSLRNLNPDETLLIQVVKKSLPFRAKNWLPCNKDNPNGSILHTGPNSELIIKAIQKTKKKVIVIDDFQYLMSFELMNRTNERGFDKFTEIAKHAFSVVEAATEIGDDKRIYILAHVTSDENGERLKTIGKMLDEKIVLEGMFTIVLKTVVTNGVYEFSTVNSGSDTVKTPIDMFESGRIPNDLKLVDEAIVNY
jgi:predicted ATP-dependent serine protease